MTGPFTPIIEDTVDYLLPAMVAGGANKVGLIGFGNEVHILSYYTNDLQELRNQVNALSVNCFGYRTALWDALITALVYEDPKPNGITIYSDMNNNQSSINETEFNQVSTRVNVPLDILEIPEHWTNDYQTNWINGYSAFLPLEPLLMYVDYRKSVAQTVESITAARLVKNPKDLFKIPKK
jgi:hypothetical protein